MEKGTIVIFTDTVKQPQLCGLLAKVVNDRNENQVDVEISLHGGKVTHLTVGKEDVQAAPVKQDDFGVWKRYLVTHPLRQGRLTLYLDNKVSFAHMGLGGVLLEDCPKHGNWELMHGRLVVTFHHQAKAPEEIEGKLWSYEKKHTYIQYNNGSDVWHLTGIVSEHNARDAAVLEPWPEQK